jgi:CheY-like chemotaxis protein
MKMAKEILIVDSDVADQEEFKRIFDAVDYHLIFSENAEDALFRVRLYKPDLLIATMTVGEKTGLELCETLKSNPQLADIPFILLTEIFDDVSERIGDVFSWMVLSKPFERNEILDLADQLILKGGTGVRRRSTPKVRTIIDLFEVVEEPEPK